MRVRRCPSTASPIPGGDLNRAALTAATEQNGAIVIDHLPIINPTEAEGDRIHGKPLGGSIKPAQDPIQHRLSEA